MEEPKVVFGILDMIHKDGKYISNNYQKQNAPVQIANALTAFFLPQMEIGTEYKEVDSSPEKKRDKFVRFASFARNKKIEEASENVGLSALPTLPSEIFKKLPEILQRGCIVFTDERERDVFLTGSLGILSGCFYSVSGTYDQRTVYANFNAFVVAPPASGKGTLVFARTLGQPYHDKMKRESEKAKRKYVMRKESLLGGKKDETEEVEAPRIKILFIPGNISSAALIKILGDSDGKGVLCETEADTITNSLKQEWGNFSDLIRKSFHHENIGYSRKKDNEHIEIATPQLSVVISGTPSQVTGLIKSVEDGLYSRFVFYAFESKSDWRDVSPQSGRPNLTEYFSTLANEVLAVIEFNEQYPAKFDLSKEQFVKLNTYFSEALSKLSLLVGTDVDGTIKRLSLITYRIAMVLSCLRKYETGDKGNTFICSDTDFDTAMKLTEVYLQHNIYMMSCLPKADKLTNNGVRKLYDALPASFERKSAIEIGDKIQIRERTTDKYLKNLLATGLLKQEKSGSYEKV